MCLFINNLVFLINADYPVLSSKSQSGEWITIVSILALVLIPPIIRGIIELTKWQKEKKNRKMLNIVSVDFNPIKERKQIEDIYKRNLPSLLRCPICKEVMTWETLPSGMLSPKCQCRFTDIQD